MNVVIVLDRGGPTLRPTRPATKALPCDAIEICGPAPLGEGPGGSLTLCFYMYCSVDSGKIISACHTPFVSMYSVYVCNGTINVRISLNSHLTFILNISKGGAGKRVGISKKLAFTSRSSIKCLLKNDTFII